MRYLSFRTFFAMLLSVTLAGCGIYFSMQILHSSAIKAIVLPTESPSHDLLDVMPYYHLEVTTPLTLTFFLIGVLAGLSIADSIVNTGKSLEKMSATDKIAVGAATFLAAIIALLFYQVLGQLLSQLKVETPIFIGIFALISVALLYLCIVATMSMKNELVSLLSRGSVAATPEVEVSPMAHCKILDTNVIIDGRIADVCRAGFLEGPLYVPGFVLEELQHIADSGDSLKRARGRRGLDILNMMQKELPLVVRSWDKALEKVIEHEEVDSKLVRLAKALDGAIVTNDFNLNKVAVLQGVQVLNVNELANAVKPVVLPGEVMRVAVVKEGKEPNQGVAYLDDGTMIVVEDGRKHMNETLNVVVTSVLQTVAGKMIFARVRTEEDGENDEYHGRVARDPRNDGGTSYGGGYRRGGQSKKIR